MHNTQNDRNDRIMQTCIYSNIRNFIVFSVHEKLNSILVCCHMEKFGKH